MNKSDLPPETDVSITAKHRTGALRSLLALFTQRERKRGIFLLIVAIAMALIETLGATSLVPFLAVLGNPNAIYSNHALHWLFAILGYSNVNDFLFALGIAALTVVLLGAIFRAAAQYAIFRFANMRRYSVSVRLFKGYLAQPYSFFLGRNSADLAKRALSDVDIIVENCLMPGVQLVAYAMVVTMLVTLLLIIDPLVGVCVFTVLCGFYVGIYLISRNLLRHIGADRNLANRQRFTEASEAFGGIKEIKLLGREEDFTKRFMGPAYRFAKHRATSDTIALVPRYLIEAVAFGGGLGAVLVYMRMGGDLGSALPVLGLYAFAGYRLLPAVQQIYNGLTRIRFSLPMVASIEEDLSGYPAPQTQRQEVAALAFRRSVRFSNVTFQYPGSTRLAVDSLNLEITSSSTVGLIGATGAGKTTAVDLLLGLLEPTTGCILIDDEPLAESNRQAWQRNIGYVPQMIFLADASVAENIAFGVAPEAIDRDAVERAARIANIHQFVTIELPKSYDTVIGERGVRLSGGQRQRIGIARALYHDPSLLVFDEATSALDDATEAAVLEAIDLLHHEKTIVTIAHRMTTIEGYDQIWRFEEGRALPVNLEREKLSASFK